MVGGRWGVARNEEQLLAFLKREGFRGFKVQLPMKPLPAKPPAFHPWGRQLWQFQIPTSLLPVHGNALDDRGRPPHHSRRRGVNYAAVTTGKRRSGHRTSLQAHSLIDLAVYWL